MAKYDAGSSEEKKPIRHLAKTSPIDATARAAAVKQPADPDQPLKFAQESDNIPKYFCSEHRIARGSLTRTNGPI
jgi:hypothetical protein